MECDKSLVLIIQHIFLSVPTRGHWTLFTVNYLSQMMYQYIKICKYKQNKVNKKTAKKCSDEEIETRRSWGRQSGVMRRYKLFLLYWMYSILFSQHDFSVCVCVCTVFVISSLIYCTRNVPTGRDLNAVFIIFHAIRDYTILFCCIPNNRTHTCVFLFYCVHRDTKGVKLLINLFHSCLVHVLT